MHATVETGVPGAVIIAFHALDNQERILECAHYIVKRDLFTVSAQAVSALRAAPDSQQPACLKLFKYPVYEWGRDIFLLRKRRS